MLVYIESHVTLHAKADAQKVNLAAALLDRYAQLSNMEDDQTTTTTRTCSCSCCDILWVVTTKEGWLKLHVGEWRNDGMAEETEYSNY